MQTLSRRQLIRNGTAIALGTLFPLKLCSSAYAFPWVTATLAAGSFVAGMIAAHNRRNLDIYQLTNIRDELRVATTQLASLQAAVGVVFTEISKLPKEIEELLRNQSILDIHARIKANVSLYAEEISLRPSYSSDLEWFRSSRRKEKLNKIFDDISFNRELLINSPSALDPNSTLAMSSAALVQTNLMNIGNTDGEVYDKTTILHAIDRHDEYFKNVMNDKLTGSAAWYKEQHENAKRDAVNDLNRNTLWQTLRDSKSIFNCAQIQAFRPALYKPDRQNPVCKYDMSFCETVYLDQHRLYQRFYYEQANARNDPQVVNLLQSEQLAVPSDATLQLIQFSSDKPTYQYRRNKGESWGGSPLSDNPDDEKGKGPPDNCISEPHDFWTPKIATGDRMRKIDESKIKSMLAEVGQYKNTASEAANLTTLIDRLNLETAKVAYATEALRAARETSTSLSAIRKSYQ